MLILRPRLTIRHSRGRRKLIRHRIHLVHIRLHLLCAIRRIKNIHRFEVKGADAPHKRLFQVILHADFALVVIMHDYLSFVQLFTQRFDLFLIVGGDILDFVLDCVVEVSFVFLDFPDLVVLLPGHEYLTGSQLLHS